MTLDDISLQPLAPDLDGTGTTPADAGERSRTPATVAAAVGLAIAVGVVARFVTVSPMWLDEALTVNIARLPLDELFEALRHDGAPPFYYLALHWWMDVFGSGDVAVRALSGLASAASLPLMWMAGQRLAGGRRWVPWAAVLLLASSPFAIRYGTEARMYSLVVLLVLAAFLALDTVLQRPSPRAAVGLGLATGLLLLTHYWSFFLLTAVGGMLALRWRDADPVRRAGARRALTATGAGCLLFLPWLPSFLEQMRTTGTPWAGPPRPRHFFDVVLQFAGGFFDTALPLGLLLYALLALGLFGVAVSGAGSGPGPGGGRGPGLVTLDLRGRPPGRTLASVAGLTMLLAIAVGRVTGSAFAIRYAAVVLPLVLLLAALGSATLSGTGAAVPVLTLAVVLGFVTAIPHVVGDRTSAGRVAAVLRADARPGDVVAYCPDQLGPSVGRVLHSGGASGAEGASGLVEIPFPRRGPPDLIDWVGYEEANEAAETEPFARMLLDRAGPERSVWVVWAPNYRTFGAKCQALLTDLRRLRPTEDRVLAVSTSTFERPGLVRYPPG
ncbi:MAG TPA: glycosyltransferase family 39 protein [Acidimicrobiales bacterium]|nr:glycosyltransferase family 39 protein [Acidimicrobiales bacterium]